jgi:hypothetical protein
MLNRRVRVGLFGFIVLLLLVNIVLVAAPAAHATAPVAYRAIFAQGALNDSSGSQLQVILDRQSGEGWQYVGAAGCCHLIFKK